MACRVRDHSIWTNRLLLESTLHDASSFLTLTYDPKVYEPWSVVPRHMQEFMKRLRYHAKVPLRFFGVGEYGDQSGRPHYHLAVFGLSTLPGPIRSGPVFDSWDYGYSFGGTLQKESAQYVAGYVTKKWTRPDRHTDVPSRLNGRYPEFARMSLRPGIGAHAVDRMSRFYQTEAGSRILGERWDVEHVFRQDGKVRQMGRYLVNRLRDDAGVEVWRREKVYWDRVNSLTRFAFNAEPGVMKEYFASQDASAQASLNSWQRVERSL